LLALALKVVSAPAYVNLTFLSALILAHSSGKVTTPLAMGFADDWQESTMKALNSSGFRLTVEIAGAKHDLAPQ
jgi:hypothetical protein